MRTTSIRTSLLLNVLALIILMAAALLLISVWGSRGAIRDLSARLIEQSASRAEEELAGFFGAIENMLQASRSWWEAGLVDYQDAQDLAALNALFIPVLDAHREVTSMMVADDSGFEYLLFRDLRGGDQYEWYNRIVQADKGPEAGLEMLWTRTQEVFSTGPLPEAARGYDPRKRPFYKEPPLGAFYWTQPYYFFITKDAGMTPATNGRTPAQARYGWLPMTSC